MRFLPLVAASLVAFGCTANRVVVPPLPSVPPRDASGFTPLEIALRDFNVTSPVEPPQAELVTQLRDAFAHYLRAANAFSAVHATPPKVRPPALLIVDTELTVSDISEVNWWAAWPAAYPFVGMWPAQPMSGRAKVSMRVAGVGLGEGAVWDTAMAAEQPWEMTWYGWYRTQPVEDAYQVVYRALFQEAAKRLRGAGKQILASVSAPEPIAERFATARYAVMASGGAGLSSQVLEEHVLAAVQRLGPKEVIGPSDVAAMLEHERRKDLLGCDDATCIAEIGGALGVDYLVVFQAVPTAPRSWSINGKLMDLRGARVLARVAKVVDGDTAAVLQSVNALVAELFASAR